jgi:hypothetical protein
MVVLHANPQSPLGTDGRQFIQNDSSFAKWGLRGGIRVDSNEGPNDPHVWKFEQAFNDVKPFRTDANEMSGVIPAQALTMIKQKVVEQRFAPLLADELFPKNREGGWMDYIQHYSEESFGNAAQICCAADFPRVSIDGRSFKTPTITIGSGFEVCYSDLMRGEAAGIDIAARLMAAAIRAIREQLNRYAFYGDTQAGILGIANNPMLGLLGMPMDASDCETDPRCITTMVKQAINNPYVTSSMANPKPDTLAIAPSLKSSWESREDSPLMTRNMLDNILQGSSIRQIVEVPEFETLGPNGKRLSLAYKRSADCVEWRVPHMIETLPPRDNGFGYEVNIIARINSLWFYYPREVVRMVG